MKIFHIFHAFVLYPVGGNIHFKPLNYAEISTSLLFPIIFYFQKQRLV
jgi:hypothetical protein